MESMTPHISPKAVIILLGVLLGVALLALGSIVGVMLFGDEQPIPMTPDESYEQLDPGIEPFPEQPDQPVQQLPVGSHVASFVCEEQLRTDIAGQVVELMFANPRRSEQNMVIEVTVREVTVARSGRIEPGYRITSLSLLADHPLTQGIYAAQIKIYLYDPTGGEQTMQTSVPVTLTVRDSSNTRRLLTERSEQK